MNVKIFGAGSIGNHFAYACRSKGWKVLMCDIDPDALERTKNDIYPGRYGKWDSEIILTTVNETPNLEYDLVIIGTPPKSHIPIALNQLNSRPPKVLLIEKPLCTPSLEGCEELHQVAKSVDCSVLVSYNHTLTTNTKIAAEILETNAISVPLSIDARFREHWGGIFAAHSWLEGPHDTYLGFSEMGGGACSEHSHCINIWQYFAHFLKLGRVKEVFATLDMVADGKVAYDRICQIHLKTEKNFLGVVVQDVITQPAQKNLRIQGEAGYLEWSVNWDSSNDAVVFWDGSSGINQKLIPKTRPDDFSGVVDHIIEIMKFGGQKTSPISLERGLETMLVIAAVFTSHKLGKAVTIDYEAGYNLNAIKTS